LLGNVIRFPILLKPQLVHVKHEIGFIGGLVVVEVGASVVVEVLVVVEVVVTVVVVIEV
jgi:hypothetical protein